MAESSMSNWAGNVRFGATRVVRAQTVAEVQAEVAAAQHVRVVGARHSFNTIADSAETLITLDEFPDEVIVDSLARTATVNANISYGRLCRLLHEQGLAVHNMASLPHISVAGAIATATHGSGDANGNLATAVAGLELVTADGELITRSRHKDKGQNDDFAGLVVGLGGVGVVTRVTLDLRPAYDVRQTLYERLPLGQIVKGFDDVMAAAYSVSLFTNWQQEWVEQVWLKELVDPAGEPAGKVTGEATNPQRWGDAEAFFGAPRAQIALHPSGRSPADNCTPQLGEVGPWHERLPHFRVEFAPASGNELQSEYFVARADAPKALQAVAALRDLLEPILIISEVRSVAADELWMSPAYGQQCVGIHFSWHNDWAAVRARLPDIEAALAPFGARPHWGKLFTIAPDELETRYPRMDDFRALLNRYDPRGKFRNSYMRRYIFGEAMGEELPV